MLNPINFLTELKQNIEQINNVKFLTIFSSVPLKIKSNNNLVIAELKGLTNSFLKINLKVYVNKNYSYENCLKFANKIIDKLNSLNSYKIDDIQLLEINYDSKSQFFYQEIKITTYQAKDDTTELKFGNETFIVQKNTIFKIERQINRLGATIYGNQFIEFQQPIKQIEGTIKFNQQTFDALLRHLNNKTIANLTFQNNTFNATLTEIYLTANETINFKFLEAFDEN